MTCRCNPASIGAEGDHDDAFAVLHSGADGMTRLCIPELCGSIPARRHHPRAVTGNSHVTEFSRVAERGTDWYPIVRIPNLARMIVAGGHHAFSIRTEHRRRCINSRDVSPKSSRIASTNHGNELSKSPSSTNRTPFAT